MIDKTFFLYTLLVVFLIAGGSYLYEKRTTDAILDELELETDQSPILQADLAALHKEYAALQRNLTQLKKQLNEKHDEPIIVHKETIQTDSPLVADQNGVITITQSKFSNVDPDDPPAPVQVMVPKQSAPTGPIPVGGVGTTLSEESIRPGTLTTCKLPEES